MNTLGIMLVTCLIVYIETISVHVDADQDGDTADDNCPPPHPPISCENEETWTWLSGIYIPINNGTEQFEKSIAIKKGSTLERNSILNEYLEKVSEFLHQQVHKNGLDPISIERIDFDVMGIEVKIEPGRLIGLSSLQLDGKLVNNESSAPPTVRLSGELKKLLGSSFGSFTIIIFTHHFDVKATATDTEILMATRLDATTCQLTVEELHIKLGPLKIDVDGFGPLDKILAHIVAKFGILFEKLLNLVDGPLKELINKSLDHVAKSDELKHTLGCQ